MSSDKLIRQAVLLAGGTGTRLKPYTTVFPKPLLPVGKYPILEIVIRQLSHFGFDRITLAVGYLAELILAYFGRGERFGVTLNYSREEQPLGTAGPLGLLRDDLDSPFLVMNGDIMTDLDFDALMRFHQQSEAAATIVVTRRSVKIDFGVIHLDDNDHVKSWSEKPEMHYHVSAGIYVFDPEVLDYLPRGEPFDLPDLIMHLVEKKVRIKTRIHDGYWLDIGRSDDYERAVRDFEKDEGRWLGGESNGI